MRRAGVTVPLGAKVSFRFAASTGLVASAAADPVARSRASRIARDGFTPTNKGQPRAAGNGKADAYSGSAVPSTTQARLEVAQDQDVFQFVLTQAATVSLATTGSLDTYGTLRDASGQTLAEDDDLGVGWNFRIRRKLAAGTYSIVVRGSSGTETGAYGLRITQ